MPAPLVAHCDQVEFCSQWLSETGVARSSYSRGRTPAADDEARGKPMKLKTVAKWIVSLMSCDQPRHEPDGSTHVPVMTFSPRF
jgi:hypothetical protein